MTHRNAKKRLHDRGPHASLPRRHLTALLRSPQSYKTEYGVRSIKSAIETRVVNELAKAHCRGDIGTGASVIAGVDDKGRVRLRCVHQD